MQARSLDTLIGGEKARTYRETAELLEISIKTLYTHLRRAKANHPEFYRIAMIIRKGQLATRHKEALARWEAHNQQWHRSVWRRKRFLRSVGLNYFDH